MRSWQLGWLVLPLALAGCGGDSPKATISVTCGEGTAVMGARSLEVLGDLVNGRPAISFPDPANPGKIGILAVPPASRCLIKPEVGSGG